ncbi:MAG: DUF3071 domain-containing protein, partial [Bifidobacteriaceae bacterium]|nr:DUF3071 domain-containing protein [Bifidobacteriaceae bacterium]
MNELTFDRVQDGKLIARDQTGAEFALRISEAVRSAVRDHQAPEVVDMVLQIPDVLRPKDIQALVRAGASPAELSRVAGVEIGHVNRYAAPVLDERAYVAERARALSLNREPGAPSLEELAVGRLAERGVDRTSLVWDAVRQGPGWVVRLDFESTEGPTRARWRVDLGSATLLALDEQARWIAQTPEADAPIPPRRLLSAVPSIPHQGGPDQLDSPLSLLDDLLDARGLRDPVAPGGVIDPLGADADVLELRRGDDSATTAVSYLDPEPLDTAGNPITFLQDDGLEPPAHLPEPALPPEPLPSDHHVWGPPADAAVAQGELFEAAPVATRDYAEPRWPDPDP